VSAGGAALERPRLAIGFVPLTDCAPLVVALEKGFFAREGLEVDLSREASWASVRDRLAYDELDAAQMLAPMPISMGLGLLGVRRRVVVPMTLQLNGNAITVSTALFEEMRAAAPEAAFHRPVDARPLRALVEARRRGGGPSRSLPTSAPCPRTTTCCATGSRPAGWGRAGTWTSSSCRRRRCPHGSRTAGSTATAWANPGTSSRCAPASVAS
jgi:hypothetical protein